MQQFMANFTNEPRPSGNRSRWPVDHIVSVPAASPQAARARMTEVLAASGVGVVPRSDVVPVEEYSRNVGC